MKDEFRFNLLPIKVTVNRERICNKCRGIIEKGEKVYFWRQVKSKDAYTHLNCMK